MLNLLPLYCCNLADTLPPFYPRFFLLFSIKNGIFSHCSPYIKSGKEQRIHKVLVNRFDSRFTVYTLSIHIFSHIFFLFFVGVVCLFCVYSLLFSEHAFTPKTIVAKKMKKKTIATHWTYEGDCNNNIGLPALHTLYPSLFLSPSFSYSGHFETSLLFFRLLFTMNTFTSNRAMPCTFLHILALQLKRGKGKKRIPMEILNGREEEARFVHVW